MRQTPTRHDDLAPPRPLRVLAAPAGPGAAWVSNELAVALYLPGTPPAAASFHCGRGDALLAWVASGEAVLHERQPGGTWFATRLRQGEFRLRTSADPAELRWTGAGPGRALHVRIGPDLLARTVRDVAGADATSTGFALRELAGARDDVLHALLDLLAAHLRAGGAPCASFLGSLAQAVTAHLVRRYAAALPFSAQRGLPAYKLELVLQAMLEHLGERFDLAALARQADLSVFHFSRAFKLATGLSPSRYFVKLRMREARRMLSATSLAVIDIALSLGYRSPSHFSQVFRDATGVSPSAYRDGHTTGEAGRQAG